jgi:hypothetical protein
MGLFDNITGWELVQKGIEAIQSSFASRINTIARLGKFTNCGGNWDYRYGAAGIESPHNAYMLGLVLVDWDNSFKTRNVKIRTEDLQIPFQYIKEVPEWKKTANYTDAGSEIMGRFESIPIYASSAAQEFELTIIYQAETITDMDASTWWSMEKIDTYIKRLQSLVYPTYTQGFAPPLRAKLNIGNIFRNFPVVIREVGIKNTEGAYHAETGIPITREITLNMKSAYPMWQALSGDKIFVANVGNDIFAYEELNETYMQRSGAVSGTRQMFNM